MRRCLNCCTYCVYCRSAIANDVKCLYGCKDVVMVLYQVIGIRNKDSHRHNTVSVGLDSGLQSIAVGQLLRGTTILLNYLDSITKDRRAAIICRGCPANAHNCILIGYCYWYDLNGYTSCIKVKGLRVGSETKCVLRTVSIPIDTTHLDRGGHCMS